MRLKNFFVLSMLLSTGLVISGCSLWSLPQVSLPIKTDVDAGGFHSVYVDSEGQVWTWGDNQFGQLGLGHTQAVTSPHKVEGLPVIAAIDAGGSHTLALSTTGDVWAWGGNHDSTLGVSTAQVVQSTPIQISGLDHITSVAAGDGHGVALRSDGTVWTWGINTDGQTGLGQDSNHPFPEQVPGFLDAVAIGAGDFHTLIAKRDGSVWAAGLNTSGQVSNTKTENLEQFEQIESLTSISQVAGGEFFSIALDNYGDVWTWGDNRLGQAGVGNQDNSTLPNHPNLPQLGIPFVQVVAGGSHALALDENGTLYSWGYNGHGQLGYQAASSVVTSPALVDVGQAKVVALAASENHTLALTQSGEILAWGDNQFGQLGTGTTEPSSQPAKVLEVQ